MSFSSYLKDIKSSLEDVVSSSSLSSLSSSDDVPTSKTRDVQSVLKSPLPRYPDNAPLGEYFNCYSQPDAEDYKIRGHNYLKDKKKIKSGPFLLPLRGIDLFLTKTTPVNVGSNPQVLGGRVREEPTFIVNFRVPWGVVIFYSKIPERFLPFIRKGRDPKAAPQDLPSLNNMSPSDRALCRWFVSDDTHRNATLKIIPVIVQGPSIVKSTVSSKPAIIGKQLPIDYIYQPADTKLGLSEYFEIDLDITASSVAKRILSVVYSNTKSVTFDLGFVIEGTKENELPEQMLLSGRIHGLDPKYCPTYPTEESLSSSEHSNPCKE